MRIIALFIFLSIAGVLAAQRPSCDKIPHLNILSEEPLSFVKSKKQLFWFDVDSSFYDMKFLVDSSCHMQYDFYDYNKYCTTNEDSILPSIGFTTFERTLETEEILNGQCFCATCSQNHRIQLEHGKKFVVVLQTDCDTVLLDTRITDDILALQREKKLKWYQKKYKKGDKLVLNNILFQANSTQMIPRSRSELSSLVYLMKNNPTLKIEVHGHVNAPKERNSDYNLQLSEGRAKAIYDYLIKNGIDGSRLGYKGFGNTQMIFPNAKSELEMKFNRRVEILVVGN
ncbi:MAG: OmpA family protein [Bacteroidetes bacterium]|nr:OmpA family protein [Bacteroidota bacterium]